MSKEIKGYSVKLVTEGPFRIGAFQDVMSGIHNPVAKIGENIVIQGPSLKGALRANIEEYLIQEYPDNPEMKPCIPSPQRTLSDEENLLIEGGKYRKGGGCRYSRRDRSETICPVCYLLGAQGLIGFVSIPYLYPSQSVNAEELYSVRIDRATGVVAEGTNRDYEVIQDGVEFTGRLEILIKDPAKGWELGKPRQLDRADGKSRDKWLESSDWDKDKIIQELIVDRLKSLDVLGGFKSKGCGKVKIEVEPD